LVDPQRLIARSDFFLKPGSSPGFRFGRELQPGEER
jgi:hypothetical protein